MPQQSSVIPILRQARPSDAFAIVELYQSVYEGRYPDPMMANSFELRSALTRSGYFWMVAEVEVEGQPKIVGSVIYRYDFQNAIAKVYAAVVDPAHRGNALTERLMTYGYEVLEKLTPPVEVVYATTRTVSSAPQKLTAHLGYKKLGIFPNVHKTNQYETHCLTAFFSPTALSKRFVSFSQHPKVLPIYELTADECGLPPMKAASLKKSRNKKTEDSDSNLNLEAIEALEFVRHRFRDETHVVSEHHWFFPFHEPNLLLTTPDQSIEIFCYFSHADNHCVLIGARILRQIDFTRILEAASRILRQIGARYLEFIVRADETEKVDAAIHAEFIPSAYFPAMHSQNGSRYDFVAFSRSFEILNFRNIHLEGLNKKYLDQYFTLWKERSLPSNGVEE